MTVSKSGSSASSRRVWLAGLAALIAAAIVSAFAGGSMRRPVFDLWQRMAPRDLSGSKVHLVLIDSESLKELGPWPWPRFILTKLLQDIAASKPRAIGFDMIFAEPDRFENLARELDATSPRIRALQTIDADFGAAIGSNPVVLGRMAVEREGADPGSMIVDNFIEGAASASLRRKPRALANIDILETRPLGHGLLNAEPDPDGKVRAIPMLWKVGGRPMPSLSLELARTYLGEDGVEAGRADIGLGKLHIPVDRHGEMLLHFGRPGGIPTMSAVNAMRKNLEPDAFAGQVVLIGLGAEGTVDIVSTPVSRAMFGPDVQAQAVDAILRGGWLIRPAWAAPAEWGGGILLSLAILWLVPGGRRSFWLVPAALAVAIPVACWSAFMLGALLLDPLRPLLLGGATAAGVAGSMFVEARRERERLRETLVRERIAAAATEGELQAARKIQLDMLPPRADLAAIDPRLDVDALLEPARSIGGDLYDVIRLDAHRIAFLVGDVTGKGVPAALFMALSKALTKSVVLRGAPSLAAAAAILNQELMRDNSELNVTMLIGIVDLATGEVMLMSAGHEHPIHIRADGAVVLYELDGGPPFCIVDFPYPDEPMKLMPGEALVLISDGVSEALDGSDALFGHDRLVAALRGKQDAAAMTEAIRDAVRSFEDGTDPTDDLTVLAVRYLG